MSSNPRSFAEKFTHLSLRFWALVLMSTDNKRPITSALGRLQGEFVTDYNLLAAGAMIAAIPTLLVFFILRKQFVSGLTLGATKG